MKSDFVTIYEWVDCQGEVEDFIVLDMLCSTNLFFDFPDAIVEDVVDKEEADLLRLDYEMK
jgi:hypothetical protein